MSYESNRLSELALNLLTLAGGRPDVIQDYYFVLSGGSDDIIGMCVSQLQLDHWLELGEAGKQIHDFLEENKVEKKKAYGFYCYDTDTILLISQKMDVQNHQCIPV